jgi:glycerophosphoryl diester phosphodiesterase
MRPAVRRLLAALLATSAVLVAAPAVAETDFSVTAHRGGPTRTLGENTFAAFRNALAEGATAIETDVRRTGDDEMVVLHDSGLGRTTTCTGPIGAWTRARLDRQCVERTSRRPIPHAEDLLAFAARRDFSLMVELKGSNWSAYQVRRVVSLVKDAGLVDRVAISSLRVTVLERVRRLAPRVDTQLIVSGWRKVRESRGRVDGYNVPAAALTRARVKALHRHDISVIGGGESTSRDWARFARVGVDGVVTDRVPAYRSWLG